MQNCKINQIKSNCKICKILQIMQTHAHILYSWAVSAWIQLCWKGHHPNCASCKCTDPLLYYRCTDGPIAIFQVDQLLYYRWTNCSITGGPIALLQVDQLLYYRWTKVMCVVTMMICCLQSMDPHLGKGIVGHLVYLHIPFNHPVH